MQLPAALRTMLDGPNFAHVATVMPDGSPQVSTVWVERDGDRISFNTAEGRVKTENIKRDDRVALSIYEQDNPYVAAAIQGRVVEMTHDGADDQIDRLAAKYLGVDAYPWKSPDETRVRIVVDVESVGGLPPEDI